MSLTVNACNMLKLVNPPPKVLSRHFEVVYLKSHTTYMRHILATLCLNSLVHDYVILKWHKSCMTEHTSSEVIYC